MRAPRSEQLMVRLSPEIKDKFKQLCEAKGMNMGTVAAFMIGEYVQQNCVDVNKTPSAAGRQDSKM